MNDIPAGSVALIAYDNGPVPPLAVTGVKAVYATFAASVVLGTDCVATSDGLTVRLNACDAEPLAASLTVMVKLVVASGAVGVPEICPVLELMLMPDGRDPPLSTNRYGVVPPPAMTGVKAV